MTILVTGSRGRVGAGLIDRLHRHGVDVRAGSNDPAALALPDGVAHVRCALAEPDTFPAALRGITSVFLYANPAAIDEFLRQAADAGVRHVVLLSSSAVLAPDPAGNPVAAEHVEVEQAVAASGLPSTVLRPGTFATNALGWTWPVKATGTIDLPYPEAHTDPIHEADLADAAFGALTDPVHIGRTYHLTGPESLTFTEQAGRIAKATGIPVTVNEVEPDAWKAAMAEYLPGHFADALLDLWHATDGTPVPVTDAVERLTGHPGRTFADWAADHAEAFTR